MTEQGRKFMLELIKCSQHRRLDTYDGSVVEVYYIIFNLIIDIILTDSYCQNGNTLTFETFVNNLNNYPLVKRYFDTDKVTIENIFDYKSPDLLSFLHEDEMYKGYYNDQVDDLYQLKNISTNLDKIENLIIENMGDIDFNYTPLTNPSIRNNYSSSNLQRRMKLRDMKKSYGNFMSTDIFKSANGNIDFVGYSYPHILLKISQNKIRSELGFLALNSVDLNNGFEKLKNCFQIDNFNLKHYTQQNDDDNFRMLYGNEELYGKKIINFNDSSSKDVSFLKNGNFIFFHFQPKAYDVPIHSRFGNTEITLPLEEIEKFVQSGRLNLSEGCLNKFPEITSQENGCYLTKLLSQNNIFGTARHNNHINKLQINYPLSQKWPVSREVQLVNESFYGKTILDGLYVSCCVELIRIGGIKLLNNVAETILLHPHNFGELLRRLFRLEVMIPMRVKFKTSSSYNMVRSNIKGEIKHSRVRKYDKKWNLLAESKYYY
ncbi:hypothetical protein QIW31_08465 [Francisellaceae bacterium CB299]